MLPITGNVGGPASVRIHGSSVKWQGEYLVVGSLLYDLRTGIHKPTCQKGRSQQAERSAVSSQSLCASEPRARLNVSVDDSGLSASVAYIPYICDTGQVSEQDPRGTMYKPLISATCGVSGCVEVVF